MSRLCVTEGRRLQHTVRRITPHAVAFDAFPSWLCVELREELVAYRARLERAAAARPPNSMNRYGTVIRTGRLRHNLERYIRKVLNPIAKEHFAEFGGGSLEFSHGFTVHYGPGEDAHLDMHTDDSHVTFNVCIGEAFVGGALAFCGMQNDSDGHRRLQYVHPHTVGTAVMHPGGLRHGALPVADGRRVNIILWMKSHAYTPPTQYIRSQADPVCVSFTHDPDAREGDGVQRFSTQTPVVPIREEVQKLK